MIIELSQVISNFQGKLKTVEIADSKYDWKTRAREIGFGDRSSR